jgi:hypothetical protein
MSMHYNFIPCLYYHPPFPRRLLGNILVVLKTRASKNVFDRIVNRKSRLGDLEKYDRLINDFNTDFVACLLQLLDYSGSFQALDRSSYPISPHQHV